jgi:hypothetical protein
MNILCFEKTNWSIKTSSVFFSFDVVLVGVDVVVVVVVATLLVVVVLVGGVMFVMGTEIFVGVVVEIVVVVVVDVDVDAVGYGGVIEVLGE